MPVSEFADQLSRKLTHGLTEKELAWGAGIIDREVRVALKARDERAIEIVNRFSVCRSHDQPTHCVYCDLRHKTISAIKNGVAGDTLEWLPIATVPKDGTEVLLAHGNSQWIDQWIADPKFEVRDGEGGCWMMCDQWEEPETPSHWKPLSPLPIAAV